MRPEDHEDYPKVNFWKEALNCYLKAENKAGAKFLANNNLYAMDGVEVGKRRQIIPVFYERLRNAHMEDTIAFTAILAKETEKNKKAAAVKSKRTALEALFWEGYKGMVAHHGWQDVFNRCA